MEWRLVRVSRERVGRQARTRERVPMMRHPIVILIVVLGCALVVAKGEPGPHPYHEYQDEVLGTCREYVQTNAHWNHSTLWVSESFPRDRTFVSMNVTSPRVGGVKLVLRRREGEELQQIRLKSFGHGGKGKNFEETTFVDDAEEHFPMWPEEAPFTGNYAPDVALSKIEGSSRGKWTLMAIARAKKQSQTPQIKGWSVTFCEDTIGDGLVTAQGAVIVNPMEPLTKPVVDLPAPQTWPAYQKSVYRGPNLLDKNTYVNFWTEAAGMVRDVTRNWNEANFYVQQVKTMQKKAYAARKDFEEAVHAHKDG